MTKMDQLGKESYESFMEYYKRIWKLYKRYGDRVIEVEFEEEGQEGQDEVKNIFLEAKGDRNFNEALRELWIKKYQIIINSCADIEKVYAELKNKNQCICIYPEKQEEEPDRFYITRDFWNKIDEQYDYKSVGSSQTYIYLNECIYEVTALCKGIRIEKKLPLASMLKDE